MKQVGSATAALGLILWLSPGSALADVAPESTSTNPVDLQLDAHIQRVRRTHAS
jgi:hypothetical protein